MAIVKFNEEIKVRVSPKRMFKAMVTDSHIVLPKISPNAFKSIDILEGDGGAGSIRQINFPDGSPHPCMKDKLDIVDPENLVVKFILFEGPALGDKIESIHSEQKFEDSGDGGCIVKLVNEHHLKGNHTHLGEEDIKAGKEQGIKFFTATEEYLIAHPDVCA